jgi:rRNA small subunit pseudouridine methyltransferase Nep1
MHEAVGEDEPFVRPVQRGELAIVLAESELELVPDEIQSHAQVRSRAKARDKPASRMLLDSSSHHSAMRKLVDSDRRGRPDLVHMALIMAQDSPLNKLGRLHTYVHTRDDRVIWVSPKERLPRNYDRFVELVEHLYEVGRIEASGETLLRVERMTLRALVGGLGVRTVLMWEQGERTDLAEVFRDSAGEGVSVLVGGFPHGDFREAAGLAEVSVRMGDEQLTAPTIVARVIFAFEQAAHLE